ncbi:MAG TPA: alkaline phosphatase family protein, partial [Acidimicrobiales bacterium]|nr:alkaline phosphatase family protein [Acidimicrobiales bacterium]
ISPFSAGGWVCSDTFDHTSVLRLIEAAFLPSGTVASQLHVSPWRISVTGDMTAALPNLTTPQPAVPALPATSLLYPDVAEQALLNSLLGTEDLGQAYPPPSGNAGVPGPDPDPITRKRTPA